MSVPKVINPRQSKQEVNDKQSLNLINKSIIVKTYHCKDTTTENKANKSIKNEKKNNKKV